jgi:hypothetical protein
VNLTASREKTVSFPNIKFFGQGASTAVIEEFSQRNDIRYIMRNALAINDKLDENPNWDGTISLSDLWDITGSSSARQFGFDIKGGVLHLEEVQEGGYALFGIRQGATLSFGDKARNFGSNAQIVLEDDARIRVKPLLTDLADSLALAEQKGAVVTLDSITYAGLGGDGHDTKRLEVQLDLSNLNLSGTVDKWIKVISSHNAPNWTNIHMYDTPSGQNETSYKVRMARPDHMNFDGNINVTPFCDENLYDIYAHIKVIEEIPVPDNLDPDLATPAETNVTKAKAGDTVELFFTIGREYAPDDIKAEDLPTGWTAVPVTGHPNGYTYKVSGPMPTSGVTFYLTGINTADKAKYKKAFTISVDSGSGSEDPGGEDPGGEDPGGEDPGGEDPGTDPGGTTKKSSGGGCDAGFAGFAGLALLLAAPMFLRKKD